MVVIVEKGAKRLCFCKRLLLRFYFVCGDERGEKNEYPLILASRPVVLCAVLRYCSLSFCLPSFLTHDMPSLRSRVVSHHVTTALWGYYVETSSKTIFMSLDSPDRLIYD